MNDHTEGREGSNQPEPPRHHFASDQRFRKQERLLKSREFSRTQRGRRFVTSDLIVIVAKGQQAWTRIGLTVSRKVGNAVVRNRVKRRLREIFRTNKAALPPGRDIVWIARPSAANASFETLLQQAVDGSNKALKRRKRSKRASRGA